MPSRRSCQCHGGINATSASSSGFRAECRSAVSASQCECLCLSVSHHLQSQDSEDAEAHKTSAQSEATEECQDSSRRFSLQELIEDEAAVDGEGEQHAATGGREEDPSADAVVQGVAEAAAAGAEKPPEQAAGRRVIIGMMRRYVRVRPIKTKHAPEKNVAPIC